MRVSTAVVERLRAAGVDTVFGIPGTQSLPLNEALATAADTRFVMVRHETAAPHAAWGYAETGDGMAATLVVPGPGDMNALNGLKNAHNDSTPLVHLSIETEPELRGGDAIHETDPSTYDESVKANLTVERPASAPAEVERAVAVARTPPQGPVRVGIPRNFLSADVGTVSTGDYRGETTTDLPAGAVDEAADLLAEAAAPVVIAGGGVRRSGASEPVRTVAERLDAPVVTTMKGKGVVPEDHALAAGPVAPAPAEMAEMLEAADAALAVGTDLDATTFGGWSIPVPDRLVHVTMHPDDLGRGYDPAVGIVGDAGATLRAIEGRLGDWNREADGAARAGAVREACADSVAELRGRDGPMNSLDVLDVAREAIPREAVVTADGGGLRIWMNPAFEAYGPDRYVQPGSWATMGTALPSAVGAAAAAGDRDVVALVGDGGLMMALHELHTVVAENLPVVTVVCNNAGYAIISESGQREFDIPAGAYDWEDAPIDFVALAEGMGMPGERVDTPAGFRTALENAVAADGPRLVEVVTEPSEPQAIHWFE